MKQALILLLFFSEALKRGVVKFLQILNREQAQKLRHIFGVIHLDKCGASRQMPRLQSIRSFCESVGNINELLSDIADAKGHGSFKLSADLCLKLF